MLHDRKRTPRDVVRTKEYQETSTQQISVNAVDNTVTVHPCLHFSLLSDAFGPGSFTNMVNSPQPNSCEMQ